MTFFQLHQSLRDSEQSESDRRERTDPTAPQSALFFHSATADQGPTGHGPTDHDPTHRNETRERPRLRLVESEAVDSKTATDDDDRRRPDVESPPLRLVGAGVA